MMSNRQAFPAEGSEEYSFSEVFEYEDPTSLETIDQSTFTEAELEFEEVEQPFVPFLFPRDPNVTVSYESTDSEVSTRGLYLPLGCKLVPGATHTIADTMSTFVLKTGYSAPEDLGLCSLRAVVTYPEFFIGEGNRKTVSETFFDKGKVFERKFSVFYLHPGDKITKKVILLVPAFQFEEFLSEINDKLGINLAIPSGGAAMAFRVYFPSDGTPRPRYLGESTSNEMMNQMKTAPPPPTYRPDKATNPSIQPDDRSIEAFRRKIDALLKIEKQKKANTKVKRQKDKIAKQHAWGESLKRVQRYLGLREIRAGHHQAMKQINADELVWGNYDEAIKTALANPDHPKELNVNLPPIFSMEEDLIFVCVDIESNERNHSQITEIGIATLDTRDIVSLAPDEGAKNWFTKIHARHFRIQEYSHIRNQDFVAGCPDRFEFGDSEFVPLEDAPKIVASCFKPPYSGLAQEDMESAPKRKVVLVGHDTMTDVKYMRDLGYNVLNLPPHEIVDTAELYRYLRREPSNRSLDSVLADLGIAGWYLHNAGNDAVYTLQSMLAISVRAIKEGESRKPGEIDEERIAEAIEQARILALEDQQGWSDDGGDGGDPVKPPTDLDDMLPGKSKDRADSSARHGIHNSYDDRKDNRASTHGARHSPHRGRGGRGGNSLPHSTTGRKAFNPPTQKTASNTERSNQWSTSPSIKQSDRSQQDLGALKELVIRATGSDDAILINELASTAVQDTPLCRLIQSLAEGKATSSQVNEFDRKVENTKNLLAWESSTAANKDRDYEDKYGGELGG